jgi:NAD(P)-dependent dehydrogenase (short-subunit alcohol dehydrogenase family)
MLIMTGYNAPLLDSDIDVARKMFDVNVFAVIEVTKAFAPLLIASKGTIVNIGSIVGHFPLPCKPIQHFTHTNTVSFPEYLIIPQQSQRSQANSTVLPRVRILQRDQSSSQSSLKTASHRARSI